MSSDLAKRYVELLKQTLAYGFWREPGVPLEEFLSGRPLLKRVFLRLAAGLRRAHLQVVRLPPDASQARELGTTWPAQAHTMIGLRRLGNLQQCVERALADEVPGDLIETGVWRGGACILMRGILAAHACRDRRVFVADSFQGLPEPDARYPADAGDAHHEIGFVAVSRHAVEENFRAFGLLDEQVVFLEGWFEDTLPVAPIESLCILRLDGDMYQSTWEALTHLYPKLSPGGFCIVDDYALDGCRQAVDAYRSEHGIDAPIEAIDWTGVYWRKP